MLNRRVFLSILGASSLAATLPWRPRVRTLNVRGKQIPVTVMLVPIHFKPNRSYTIPVAFGEWTDQTRFDSIDFEAAWRARNALKA